eukprot:1730330-Pleurochrysis_carterae.AAC.5
MPGVFVVSMRRAVMGPHTDPPSAWQVDSNGDVASSRYGGGADAATAGAAAVMAVGSSAARSAAGASRGLRVDRVVAPSAHSTLPRNVCEVVCTQQPPYFTEMLSNSETLGAHRQALQVRVRTRHAPIRMRSSPERLRVRSCARVTRRLALGHGYLHARASQDCTVTGHATTGFSELVCVILHRRGL